MGLNLETTKSDTSTIGQTSLSLQVSHLAEGVHFPALISRASPRTKERFLEFFTVNIRNPNTRAAYGRAAAAFLDWCERRGLVELAQVQPIHVAAYIEDVQGKVAKTTVKQHLATLRMLFDWLVTGQIIPSNPAYAVQRATLLRR